MPAIRFLLFKGPSCLLLALVLTFLMMARGWSADEDSITGKQKIQIEQMIHDYLMDHPEVMLRSIQLYQENQTRSERERIRSRIDSPGDTIGRNPSTPVGGNPDGRVTVVEFFDYQCGYCKRTLPAVQELIRTDNTIRLVFKEFPILGDDSVLAARASLAIWNSWPGRYVAFHDALMGSRGRITEHRIRNIAETLGIDSNQLDKALENPAIGEEIERTRELARSMGVNGTPAFVIGSKLVPGAIDLETMRQLVAQASQD